jgi:hypothetical protein
MRLLRKEVDNLIIVLLFSSLFLVLFTLPEINSYSFNEYIIGISIVFLLSLFLLKKYGFIRWSLILILFLLFTLIREDISILTSSLVFILFPFYWLKLEGKKYNSILKEYGLIVKDKLKIIISGILGLFLIIFIVGLIGSIFYFFGINDQANVKEVVKSLPWIAFPIAVLIAPIAEEIFFRGFLLKKVGILISAVIFALLHFAYGSIVEITVAFVIALLLSYLFIKTKSLWPSIIAHGLFNLMSLIVMWFL